MVKKAERLAKAFARESCRERSVREESAMQSFLEECRASLPAEVWEKEFANAQRTAGETFHVVEWMVFVLVTTRIPINPQLRKSLDAMLETLGLDRRNAGWQELRRLNYGAYWKARYGY